MSLPILDTTAWREFRGKPSKCGVNETTHLAKIEDPSGKLRDCFVKLLPLNYPSLLGEAIGWLLAKASGVACPDFAAIIFVPVDELRKNTKLPSEFDSLSSCPAWCCEIVSGQSVRQINSWEFLLARSQCLHSKDARKIASFDLWTDLRDRNYGNVIRSPSGGYIAIDHETILHDLLWPPTGKIYQLRSLMEEAERYLNSNDFANFQIDMAMESSKHAQGLKSVQKDLEDIISKIYPHLSAALTPDALNFLDQRAQDGWLATKLGVIA